MWHWNMNIYNGMQIDISCNENENKGVMKWGGGEGFIRLSGVYSRTPNALNCTGQ